uniref:C2H2-type domain-containing protein n=1 Tax=Parascaris univalens TaxID=6257 RepID=A0A915BK01_PARUN
MNGRSKKNIPQTSLFLCYECGDMFTSKIRYDEHLLVHQAVSLCRQIYEFETRGLPFDDKQLHLMANSEKGISKSKKEVSLGGRREAHLQSASISSRRNTVSGLPQRKRSSEVVAKRKMTDPLPDSLICISKKKIPPKFKLKMPNPSPIDKQGKHDIPVVPVKSTPLSVAHDVSLKNSQGAPESTSAACAVPSAGPSSESKESKGGGAVFGKVATLKKLSTQAVAQNRSCSPLPLPPQKCLICDYHSSQGWEMVEHVVRVHKVSISKVEKTHFIDGEWTSKTSHPSAQKCEYCALTFMETTDYFLHIIVCHRNSMFAVGANRLNCVVHLAHPHLRVQIINITMRRPTNPPI